MLTITHKAANHSNGTSYHNFTMLIREVKWYLTQIVASLAGRTRLLSLAGIYGRTCEE